jgi:hypothetical protein
VHEGQILFRQLGDRQFQQIDLLRPRQGQQDVQRPFIAVQIDDEGFALLDLLGVEIQIGLEGFGDG